MCVCVFPKQTRLSSCTMRALDQDVAIALIRVIGKQRVCLGIIDEFELTDLRYF